MKLNSAYNLIVIISLIFSACQQPKIQKAGLHFQPLSKDPALAKEVAVIDLVWNLEEVQRARNQVEKDSKGKRELSARVETTPTATDPNYWVKVGEDNGDNYVTRYTFTVNNKNKEIKYYDAVQDTLIPLSIWRSTTPLEKR
jgi:hypothetical protein